MKFLEGLPLPQRVALTTYGLSMVCVTALVVAKIEWAQSLMIGLVGYGMKSPLFPAIPSMTIPMPPGSAAPVVSIAPPPGP